MFLNSNQLFKIYDEVHNTSTSTLQRPRRREISSVWKTLDLDRILSNCFLKQISMDFDGCEVFNSSKFHSKFPEINILLVNLTGYNPAHYQVSLTVLVLSKCIEFNQERLIHNTHCFLC